MYNTHSKYDWLFNTKSRVLQADWLILENDEKATLNINMPYCPLIIIHVIFSSWGHSRVMITIKWISIHLFCLCKGYD